MTAKPRKPWRVVLTGPDVHAESDHTSEAKAFALVRAALGGDGPADTAKVMQWEGGRWWHFETVHAEDVPEAATSEPPAEPEVRDWDDDPHTCARYDRNHWNRDED